MIEFSRIEQNKKQIDKDHLDAILKNFRTNGFVILKNIFSEESIERLDQNFKRNYRHYFVDKKHEDALQVGDKRFLVTVEVKDVFNSPQIYANPFVLSLMTQLLEENFIISDFTCVTSLPGAKDTHIHHDGGIFNNLPFASLLPPHAIGLLIPLIPLIPFNELNGATRIWPGTHRNILPLEEIKHSQNFIDPELNIGSCMLMDYRLKHSGRANHSREIRPMLCCNYCVPWYFDCHNFKKQAHLVVDDQNFKKIPEQYKAMFVRRNIKLAQYSCPK